MRPFRSLLPVFRFASLRIPSACALASASVAGAVRRLYIQARLDNAASPAPACARPPFRSLSGFRRGPASVPLTNGTISILRASAIRCGNQKKRTVNNARVFFCCCCRRRRRRSFLCPPPVPSHRGYMARIGSSCCDPRGHTCSYPRRAARMGPGLVRCWPSSRVGPTVWWPRPVRARRRRRECVGYGGYHVASAGEIVLLYRCTLPAIRYGRSTRHREAGVQRYRE